MTTLLQTPLFKADVIELYIDEVLVPAYVMDATHLGGSPIGKVHFHKRNGRKLKQGEQVIDAPTQFRVLARKSESTHL